jgi:ribose transport system substrate-binding protein
MRDRFKTVRAAACLLALTLSLTACGGALSGGGDDGGSDKQKKVAVLLYSQGFEFMVALGDGIKQEAKRHGIEVTVLDAQEDSANQIQQIEDQLAKGVDGIILSPNNSEELLPGVKKINDADVPVVTVDSLVAGGKVNSAIAYDNVQAGEMGAKALADLMQDKGTAFEYEGRQGAFHAIRRGKGFKDGMKAFPDVEVISRDSDWTAEKALSLTVDNLTSNKSISGLFSHNDEMVRGIVSGLKQTGHTATAGQPGHIPVVGVDGTPLALQRIRSGTQDATVNQDPYVMGALAVKTLDQVFNGETVPREQLTPPSMITKDNVDDPKLWGNRFKGID